MKTAVELYFDPETEREIRAIRDRLCASDSTLENASGVVEYRPHVSLAVFDDVDLLPIVTLLEEFAEFVAQFPVAFTSFGFFPGEAVVLYLAPPPTTQLIEVHRALHDQLTLRNIPCMEYYRPGKWHPHCTLHMNMDSQSFQSALARSVLEPLKLSGSVCEIGLVECRPGRRLFLRPLLAEE